MIDFKDLLPLWFGRFRCKCGLELNADLNGARNILRRAMGYTLMEGAGLAQPELGSTRGLSLDEPRISRL